MLERTIGILEYCRTEGVRHIEEEISRGLPIDRSVIRELSSPENGVSPYSLFMCLAFGGLDVSSFREEFTVEGVSTNMFGEVLEEFVDTYRIFFERGYSIDGTRYLSGHIEELRRYIRSKFHRPGHEVFESCARFTFMPGGFWPPYRYSPIQNFGLNYLEYDEKGVCLSLVAIRKAYIYWKRTGRYPRKMVLRNAEFEVVE